MISFDSSSFYLINVLLGLTIGFIAKIVMRPSKPPTAATLSDIWIWLALGVLGAIGGSLMGSLFGWIKPHVCYFFGAFVMFYERCYLLFPC